MEILDRANRREVTHREVPIKLITKVTKLKAEIRSNNEYVLNVAWFLTSKTAYAEVTFEYFDGYQMSEDIIIQLL